MEKGRKKGVGRWWDVGWDPQGGEKEGISSIERLVNFLLVRALFLLPRGQREGIEDVAALQNECEEEDFTDGQNPDWAAELENGDPFAVAEEMERSIPVQSLESEEDQNDPFRDISLFRVSGFRLGL